MVQNDPEHKYSKSDRPDEPSRQHHNDSEIAVVLGSLLEQYKSQHAHQERWQQKQITWTKRAFWGLVSSAIVSFSGFVSAVIGNEINRANFIATQRPWISVKASIAAPLEISNEQITTSIGISLANGGHSPAQNVRMKMGFHIVGNVSPDMMQRWVCDSPNTPDEIVLAIFPGKDVDGIIEPKLSPTEIADALRDSPPDRGIELVLVGCVHYDFSTSTGDGETGITLKLVQADGSQIARQVGTFQPDAIAMSQFLPGHGNYAK